MSANAIVSGLSLEKIYRSWRKPSASPLIEIHGRGTSDPVRQFLMTKQGSSTSEERPDPWARSSTGREEGALPTLSPSSRPEPELKRHRTACQERGIDLQYSDPEVEDNDYMGWDYLGSVNDYRHGIATAWMSDSEPGVVYTLSGRNADPARDRRTSELDQHLSQVSLVRSWWAELTSPRERLVRSRNRRDMYPRIGQRGSYSRVMTQRTSSKSCCSPPLDASWIGQHPPDDSGLHSAGRGEAPALIRAGSHVSSPTKYWWRSARWRIQSSYGGGATSRLGC